MTQGIILAAGAGRRMKGLTNNTPKSLMEIDGLPLIERNINFMIEAGFDRILVVVGYKREMFMYLKKKYYSYELILLENNRFETTNTVSSLYEAMPYFDQDSFITTADIYFWNNVFSKYLDEGNYYILRQKETYTKPDWIASLNRGNQIVSVDKRGIFGHAYTGISHWTVDGLALIKQKLLELDWNDEVQKKQYWDELLISELANLGIGAKILDSNNEIFEFDDMDDIRFFENVSGMKVSF